MMSRRTAIMMSLGLNAALAAVACSLARREPLSAPETLVTKPMVIRAPVAAEAGHADSPPAGNSARIHWSLIESRDYPVYIANLRAIGCPEPTLRDIIYADVSEMFVRKRQAAFEPMERQFWDLMASDKAQHSDDEWQTKFDALKDEKEKLLGDLLGDAREQAAQKRRPPDPQAQLGFLSEEKQDQVARMFEKYSQLRRDLQPQSGQSIGPEGRESLKALMQQQEVDLQQLLNPEEYDEYKLRRSSAVHVVQNLYGFAPTEEESRAITRLQMDFEEGLRKSSPAAMLDKQSIQAARQQAQKRVDEQVKGVLGEDRFGEFKRASDPQFQEIYRVAMRYNLPQTVAMRVYEIRNAAEHEANRLRKDAELGEDRRQAALETIEQETERAIGQHFGASGLKTYKRHGGGWLEAMAELPADGNLAEEIDRRR
jgi:hypothetical protein